RHLALLEPGEIGLLGGGGAQVVCGHVHRVALRAADLPRQVVVPVDERRGPEKLAGVGERGVGRGRGRLRGGGSGHEWSGGKDEEEENGGARAAHRAPFMDSPLVEGRPSCTSSGRVMNSGQIERSYS